MSNENERQEIDLLDAVAPAFSAGKGVLLISQDMPDAAIILSIRQALTWGKPFTIIPSSNSTVQLAHAPQSFDVLIRSEVQYHIQNEDGSFSPVIVDGMPDANLVHEASDFVVKQQQEKAALGAAGYNVL